MSHLSRIAPFLFASALAASFPGRAGAAPGAAPTYAHDIRPILQERCVVCHNRNTSGVPAISGALALDSYAALRHGAGNGASARQVLIAGKSGESELFRRLVASSPSRLMPKGGPPLPAAEIAKIKRWIDSGASQGDASADAARHELTPAELPMPTEAATADVVLATAIKPTPDLLGKKPRKDPVLDYALKVGPLPPVTALAYSPDGRTLAAGAYRAVLLWDTATGKPRASLTYLSGAVQSIAFRPDGAQIAVAGGAPGSLGEVKIFDAKSLAPVGALVGHSDVVYQVVWNAAGTLLATASQDKTARLWQGPSGKEIRQFKDHSDAVMRTAIAVDGKSVFTASQDHNVRRFDASTGSVMRAFTGHNELVTAMALSPDGKELLSAGVEPAGAVWWNPDDGSTKRTEGGHGGPVNDIVFSKDGKFVASASADGTVRLWDGHQGNGTRTFQGGSDWLYAAAISPDDRLVAGAGADGVIRIWDAGGPLRLMLVSWPPPAANKGIDWLAVTPEGYYNGSAGWSAALHPALDDRPIHAPQVAAAIRGLKQPEAVAKASQDTAVPSFQLSSGNSTAVKSPGPGAVKTGVPASRSSRGGQTLSKREPRMPGRYCAGGQRERGRVMMRTTKRWLPYVAAFAALIGVRPPASAQTSFPMLVATYPAGVERGKTTEVTVYSAGSEGGGSTNLNGAYEALFQGAGVHAEIVKPEKGWPAPDPKTPNVLPTVASITMRVTVDAQAALGSREYRVATAAQGISTVGQLVIGDEPEVNEIEPNNDLAHAQPVTIGCVVNGRIQQGEDVDCFKFHAAAGQEVVFSVLAARLEDKTHDLNVHFDPLIVLTDPAGRELARDDDYYRADPMLGYRFEKAGDYILQIRDVGYNGNPYWVYRLEITTRPYITAIAPCAVRPGESADLQVSGFNLGSAKTAHLDVPKDTPTGLWRAQLKLAGGVSNMVPLQVVDEPQRTYAPPVAASSGLRTAALTSAAAPARGAIALPGGVNSWLAADNQIDRYTFHAKKGTAWGFEVAARRLDSSMDSEIKLRDLKGSVLAENDDAIGKDSRIDWTAPADGDYSIEIRDLAGHSGPTYFYNLTAMPLRPDFKLRCDNDRAMIAGGNRTAWFVIVDRQYGFSGPVQVAVKGLPAGMSATNLTIPPEMGQGVIFLSAAPGAKLGAALVEVTGAAAVPGVDGKPADVTHTATPMEEIYMPGGGRGQYPVETQGAAVTEPNDLEVSVDRQSVTLAPGGTEKLNVTIKRKPGYTKAVTLDLRVNHLGGVFTNPLPPGVTTDDAVSIPENQNTGTIVLRAAADAHAIKDWPIAVMANVSINFVMKAWYAAPPVLLTVTAPAKK